ncbi:unnamed protein product [Protopolystoma xenopodis]|uniref:Uncharacterized protein n=1 Tax=Protopolystoma xenopodis TaxID=117903 RepID=A0A448WWX4_9PLAT|nr:unnamed protein product [Protopolystoma xenopodis]
MVSPDGPFARTGLAPVALRTLEADINSNNFIPSRSVKQPTSFPGTSSSCAHSSFASPAFSPSSPNIQLKPVSPHTAVPCAWAVTEVNGRPISLFSKRDEVSLSWHLINAFLIVLPTGHLTKVLRYIFFPASMKAKR